MAKSLRSKAMRKNRAVKRIRYGEKELKRLNDMVERTKVREEAEAKAEQEARAAADTEMEPTEATKKGDKKTAKKTDSRKKKPEVSDNEEEEEEEEKMEVDKKARNKRTLQDEHGQYPAWMGGRRLKQQKKVAKRLKGKRK